MVKNPHSVQTKNYKLKIIYTAAEVFNLSESEKEILANKAGYTLNKNPNFNEHLNYLIYNSHKKIKLYMIEH